MGPRVTVLDRWLLARRLRDRARDGTSELYGPARVALEVGVLEDVTRMRDPLRDRPLHERPGPLRALAWVVAIAGGLWLVVAGVTR